MSTLEKALDLVRKTELRIFPSIPGRKLPRIKNFAEHASNDETQIKKWWDYWIASGICISTDSLLVLDIDVKNGKKGFDSLFELELEHGELPSTLSQTTSSGGKHLIYKTDAVIKNSVEKIGKGIDVRGKSGYIYYYGFTDYLPIAEAPEWLVKLCGSSKEKELSNVQVNLQNINVPVAMQRAIQYLQVQPGAIQGQGGDAHTFKVVAAIKDFGIGIDDCFSLLLAHFNPKCQPEWSHEDLYKKVQNVFNYGNRPPGISAPETEFEPVIEEASKSVPHEKGTFIDQFNKEYALLRFADNLCILHEHPETKDIRFISEKTFHRDFAHLPLENRVPLTKIWLTSDKKRTYDLITFKPEQKCAPEEYNLWKGFSVKRVEKITPYMQDSLKRFQEHAFVNVCESKDAQYNWLMGYFAHLIQKPWEKPLTAVVFRGLKGTGKNALVDRVGALMRSNYQVVASRGPLTNRFNSYLERCLLLVLDEAFWSGDKEADGVLKDLVTGHSHNIERKGKDTYVVPNLTRIVIVGNEKTLVNATEDERRYAIFAVGNGRKQDRDFFHHMRVGMEQGGYGLLYDYLKNFDLSSVDVNSIPKTGALAKQKERSLPVQKQWWLTSLQEGRIVNSNQAQWTNEMTYIAFKEAFINYHKEINATSWRPSVQDTADTFQEICPSVELNIVAKRQGECIRICRFPDLEVARKEWDQFIGHETNWENS